MIQKKKKPNPSLMYMMGGQINCQFQPIPWLLYLIEETPIYKYIKRCLIVCSGREREKERGTWSLGVWRWISSRRRGRWCRCHGRRRRRCPCGRLRGRIRPGTNGHLVRKLLLLYRTLPFFVFVFFFFNSTQLIWSPLSLCLFLKTILRKLSHCVFFNYRSQLKPQGNPHTEELLCCVSHWRPGKIGPHSITRPNPKEKYGYMLHGLTRFLKWFIYLFCFQLFVNIFRTFTFKDGVKKKKKKNSKTII